MTAQLNVFSNVREYDVDDDVFENVFEWEPPIRGNSKGWSFEAQESVFFFSAQTNVFMITQEEQVFEFEES
jgi:hypothetical protein